MFTKHTIALVALSLFVSFTAHAITWTGATSSAWGYHENWDEGRVPNENDDVVIPNTEHKPTIFFDAKARSIYLEPGAELVIMAARKLTVKGGGAFGFKNYGGITNIGEITIGTVDVTAGIENYGYIFNRNEIVINRATQHGIYNYNGGIFDNNGDLNIASEAVVDGVINFGTFNNKDEGSMVLDKIIRYCIDNQASGEFNNNGKITFPGNSQVNNGLNNAAVFNNEGTGELLFEQGGLDGIVNYSNGTLNNRGKIKIGTVGSYTDGIANTGGAINNLENGEIHIDRTENVGIGQSSGTFSNEGKILIGAAASVGTYGILNGMFAGFENKTGGEISINNTSNAGLYAFGLFENEGSVVIEAATGDHAFEGVLQNAACATMHVSNALNIYFENEGYLWVNTDKAHSIIGSTPAINNGVIVYPQGNLIPNVTNNDLIVLPIAGECSIANALQIGPDNDHLPSATWYKDANFTQIAGSYDAQTNTFEAEGLPEGTQTVYIGVTPLNGVCWYPTPIKVTFDDLTQPNITCPTNQTISANENCGSDLGAWSAASVSDNCTANPTVSQSPAAETALSGHNDSETVTLTADDNYGNTKSCTFTVTLKDLTKPTIICPNSIVRSTDLNQCSAEVTYAPPTYSDNCPGVSLTQTSGLSSGSTFPKGNSTVEWKATDGIGLTATCSFTVTVNDTQVPSITCPDNIVRSTDPNLCSTAVTYAPPTYSDNCTGASLAQTSGLSSGSTFPKGNNTVEWKATDGAGLTATCSFTVTVNDTQVPSISCPVNIVRGTDPNLCNALVSFANPTFSDNCPGATLVQTSGLSSGSSFPKGVSMAEWKVVDAVGLTAICQMTVTVNDTQNPSIACPANIVRNADANQCSATVTYTTPAATDNCPSVSLAQTSGLASGSAFPKGTNMVQWKATDAVGLTAVCQFTVTVNDNQAPSIGCPGNITKSNDAGQCSAVVTYATPSYSDNCADGGAAIQSGLPSGSAFPKGITTVVWKATDAVGLTKTCSFRVTVNDTQAPAITCPSSQSVNMAANTCASAPLSYTTPTATDNCPGTITVLRISGPASGSSFPAGATNVVWRAVDGAGRSSTCSFVVAVIDNQAPAITCPQDMSVTGSGNPCMANVTYLTPTATDNCGVQSVSLLSGQPSGSSFPAGATNVTWRAVDNSGLSVTCSFTVTVGCGTSAQSASDRAEAIFETSHSLNVPELRLWPNPATVEVQISVENLGETGGELMVTDAQGRLMWQQSNVQQSTATVSLEGFAAGLYFVTLRSEGQTVTKRLVKAE